MIVFFFFNDTATTEIYTLSLPDALPIYMDLAAKGLGAKEWNNSLKTKLSLLPKKLFKIRMSRNFGMKMLTMTNLSTECLIQLTKLILNSFLGSSDKIERPVQQQSRDRSL